MRNFTFNQLKITFVLIALLFSCSQALWASGNEFRPFSGYSAAATHCDSVKASWTSNCGTGNTFTITVKFTGTAPFSFAYSDGLSIPVQVAGIMQGTYTFNYTLPGTSPLYLGMNSMGDAVCAGKKTSVRLRLEPMQSPPSVVSQTFCGTGQAISTIINAGGTGTKYWYNDAGTLVFKGNSFITPALTANKTWTVSRLNQYNNSIGRSDTTPVIPGGSRFENPSLGHGLYFSVSQHSVIDSFKVIVKKAGTIVVRLRNFENTYTIDSIVTVMPVADTTGEPFFVYPRFDLQPGSYFMDAVGTTRPLAYNTETTSRFGSYINTFFSIDSSNGGLLNYYYFYRIGITSYSCPSQRASVSVNITGPATPVITANGPLSFCPGDSVTLTGPTATDYRWSNGARTQSITISSPGNYYLNVGDANGCLSFPSATKTVFTGNPFDLLPTNWSRITGTYSTAPELTKTIWPNGATGYFMDYGHLSRTTDNGLTWSSLSAGPGNFNLDMATVASNLLYVLKSDGSTGTITMTANGGATWAPVTAQPNAYSLNVSADDRLYIGNDDGSYTLGAATINFTYPAPVLKMALPGSNKGYAIFGDGAQGMIMRATNLAAGEWEELYLPSSSANFYDAYFSSALDGWLAGIEGTRGVLLHTTNGGDDWENVDLPGNDVQTNLFVTFNGNTGYVGGTNNRLYKTTDNGLNWASDTLNLTNRFAVWRNIAINPNGYKFLTGNTANNNFFKASPTVSITAGATSFCPGDSLLLTAPAGFGRYIWSNGGSTRQLYVKQPGSYTVQVGQGSACLFPQSSAFPVTVKPAPAKPAVTVTGNLTFCYGGSVRLTAGPATGPYLWTTGDTARSITISQSAKVALQIVGTQCSSPLSDSISITEEPELPVPVITASGPLSFCSGDSVILTATAGYPEYSWSIGGGTTQSVKAAVSGNYSVRIGNGAGCFSAAGESVTVAVTPKAAKPAITINSGRVRGCDGDSIVLSGPATGPYMWSTGETSRTITVKGTQEVNLYIPGSPGLCESPLSDTLYVSIIGYPAKPTIWYSGSTRLCPGDSIVLHATMFGPTPPDQPFTWSNGFVGEDLTIRRTGKYAVSFSNYNGCATVSDSVTVSVDTAGTASISQTGTHFLCAGDPFYIIAGNGNRFLWSNGETDDTLRTTTTGIYSVRSVTPGGCMGPVSEPVTLIFDRKPNMPENETATASFCAGSSITLNVREAAPEARYVWTGGQTGESIVVNRPGLYRIVAVSPNGTCYSDSSAGVMVTMTPAPAAPTITSVTDEFCQGDSLMITATTEAGLDFHWTDGSTAGLNRWVYAPGEYFAYSQSPATGCRSAAASRMVFMISRPNATTVSANRTTSCEGDTIIVSAPFGYTSYMFTGHAPQSSEILKVAAAGSYSIRVAVSVGNCRSDSSAPVTFRISPYFRNASGLSFNLATNTLTSNTAGAQFYTWFRNNVEIAGETNRSLVVTQLGYYQVQPLHADTCGDKSDSLRVTELSANAKSIETQISLYPNPGQNELMLQLPADAQHSITQEGLEFSDAIGRRFMVPAETKSAGLFRMGTSALAPGVYTVSVPVSGRVMHIKWVKQ